jgi:phenylalanyl-tRNA synthetase alpha chain
MNTYLSPAALAADLAVRDLTDPAGGPHALQTLVAAAGRHLAARWDIGTLWERGERIVSVADNYDRLGYPAGAAARDRRYTRYVAPDRLLRTQTSALIPPALRRLARRPVADVLVVAAGMVYRRDVIDRLHTGMPHQADLWRIRTSGAALTVGDLDEMVAGVLAAVLPGRAWRTIPAVHPYTTAGREIEVAAADGQWVEVGECGLAHPGVLAGAGLAGASGLAMGLGLDRLLMLRKGIDDIRLLRAADPRIAGQMLGLDPYRPVSAQPAARRDVSVACDEVLDDELAGDRVRDALGTDADLVEQVRILSATPAALLPPAAADRLRIGPGQVNLLVRVVLRAPARSIPVPLANRLRDRIHAALHHPSGE